MKHPNTAFSKNGSLVHRSTYCRETRQWLISFTDVFSSKSLPWPPRSADLDFDFEAPLLQSRSSHSLLWLRLWEGGDLLAQLGQSLSPLPEDGLVEVVALRVRLRSSHKGEGDLSIRASERAATIDCSSGCYCRVYRRYPHYWYRTILRFLSSKGELQAIEGQTGVSQRKKESVVGRKRTRAEGVGAIDLFAEDLSYSSLFPSMYESR